MLPTLLFTFLRFHHFCLTQLRQYQPSNVARELKQKLGVGGQGGGGVGGEVGGGQGGPRDDFVLGQEPQGGVPSKEAAVKQSTASRLSVEIFILCSTLQMIQACIQISRPQVPIPTTCDKLP